MNELRNETDRSRYFKAETVGELKEFLNGIPDNTEIFGVKTKGEESEYSNGIRLCSTMDTELYIGDV